MAAQRSRPGRTLVVFLLAILVMYVGLWANGEWKPKLGLDLQGGTRITLTASTATGEQITPEKMAEAASIIDSRVNASGVSESEVNVQGDDQIVVEIPGSERKDLVETVKQQAQLRFRLVAASAAGGALPEPTPAPSGSPSGSPSPGASPSGSPKPSGSPQVGPEESASPAGRAAALAEPSTAESDTPRPKPTAQPSGQESEEPAPQPPAAAPVPTDKSSINEQLAWMRSPDAGSLADFQAFTCEAAADQADDPSKPLLACDEDGNKYLLSPAIIEGTQLDDADYGIPQNDVNYAVTLDFNGEASNKFADVTTSMAGTSELFAIVLDGVVLSAPQVNQPITNGSAQITGDFTSAEAQSLANSLKYGALPLQFEVPLETVEGPTLAADQLDAGLLAGAAGMGLVLLYCMLYYRALGVVVVASLAVAAAITYAAVIFLSETAGFTLTLPGIAGLIVAVGITADSFIVYFERLRDELRDGKTLRVAVEAAWVRARATCVAADAVSLLAAVVLYIFAIGVVKGFAFALGISTLIDLVVFFWFTKPMVTWLARFKLFRTGHKMSGLSPDHVGTGATVPVPATGGAR